MKANLYSIPYFIALCLLLLCIFQIPQLEAISPFRQSSICGPALCVDHGKKFHFKQENAYIYQYNVNGTTSIFRGPTEQTGLHMSAQIAIKFLSPCEAALFIKDVELYQSQGITSSARNPEHSFTKEDQEQNFKNAIEEFPLRFSYGDGLIEEVCPDLKELPWVLNIKRGILSSLQNSMKRLDLEHKAQEDDIHGHCKAEYKIGTATASSLTIDKIKDISSCGDKFGVFSSVQGTPYHFGTKYQSMPAVASTSECHQIIDRNLIAKIQCSETHRLKTLARGLAGVVSNIQQSFELTTIYDPNYVPPEEKSAGNDDLLLESTTTITTSDNNKQDKDSSSSGGGNPKVEEEVESNLPPISTELPPLFSDLLINYGPEKVLKRESLHFKHDYSFHNSLPLSASANDLTAGRKALQNFCNALKDEVTAEAGDAFDTLVSVLRSFTLENMMALSKEATVICQGDRTHFDNALEAVGTAASVGVIKEKILQRDAPRETIESWISSLTYIPKPDLDVMEAAVDILKERDSYPQILLTFSSLAHSYCRHKPHCTTERPINILIKLYEKIFSYTKCIAKTAKDVEQLIMYLKGVGNFGQFSDGINESLFTCINQNDREEVKVAAIEAYRRMNCNSDQSMFGRVFENESEDSEVRIAAFISLMRCPTYSTIRSIKETLEREQVNQVGSFVWTYLKNIQKTALPSKAELQGLVADENLSKKFTIDVRKFSRNFEISTFHDDLNFGVGLENNLIFSHKSYLPRSAMLNLTVDLFGESINVFEAGLRLENFEHYIESLFGPKGKFRNPDLHAIISSFREKRAVPSKRKLKTLSTEYDAHKRYYSDPISSLSLKIFGNEVLYKRKSGVVENDILASLNPFQFIKQFGDKSINWKKSIRLIESSYIIPTGVGIPLNLSAQASAMVRLNALSFIQTENLQTDGELKIKGKFEPSALLTVKGSMTFGTAFLQTGVQVRSHIRTSTAMEGSFHIKGKKLLKIDVGLPKSKQEILEYKSDLLFIQGNNNLQVVGRPHKLNPICTNGFLESTLGIKFCKSSYLSLSPGSERDNLLSPYFPLNGPAQYLLTVEKTNPTYLSTRINYEWDEDEKGKKLRALYELQGPENIKLVGFDYTLNKLNQDFSLGIYVPGNSLEANGFSKDKLNGGLNITTMSNGVRTFNTLVSYTKKPTASELNADVEMSVTMYDNKLLDAKGKITQNGINEEGINGTSFNGNGFLYLRNNNQIKLQLKGHVNQTKLDFNLDGQYKSETFNWNSVINKLAKYDDDKEITSVHNFVCSEFPDYNMDVNWRYRLNDEEVSSEFDFRMGKGPSWSDRSALRIKNGFINQRGYDESKRGVYIWISQPSNQIDFGFGVSHIRNAKNWNSLVEVRLTPEKNLKTSFSLKTAPGLLTFIDIGWNTTISYQPPLQVSLNLEEISSGNYQGRFYTDWFGSSNINVGMNFMDRTYRQILNKQLKISIETTGLQQYDITFLIYHDPEKESRLLLNTESQNHVMAWEIVRNSQNNGPKQNVLLKFINGQKTYLISTDLNILVNDFYLIIKSDFLAKFPDILLELKLQQKPKMQSIDFVYKWNAVHDESKQIVFNFIIDSNTQRKKRTELKIHFPGQDVTFTGEIQQTGSYNDRNGATQIAMGRLNWNDEMSLHANTTIAKRQENYESHLQVILQRNNYNDAIYSLRVNCDKEIDCQVQGNVKWDRNEYFDIILGSKFRYLPPEEEDDESKVGRTRGAEENEDDDEDYDNRAVEQNRDYDVDNDGEDDDDDDDNDNNNNNNSYDKGGSGSNIEKKSHGASSKKTSSFFSSFRPFSFSLQGNTTSSLDDWKDIQISMLHSHHSLLHLKTDIDIQLSNGRDINFASHWIIPTTWRNIWSTRVELHVKTPFETLQNFHLQAIVGQQEDSDTLATAGIYTDNIQYSMTITGTPRFGDDGSLRIEISTSNADYDKIFSSLSYAIGDSSRFAYQLGWPNVVISLETGFEWSGSWEEFQVYYTFTSPWKPLKNINALAKIDTSQIEAKVELNDKGIAVKCEWVIESLATFDIRFEGTTPFTELQRIGFLLKNSFEDDVSYHSQVSIYANERQVGYKLEGGHSEVEEGAIVAVITNSQIEIDTLIYPTVRSTFNLVQKETKYNLGLSLLLREGPINMSVELHLLDLFSFNEKIKITTPYSGLFELEVDLSPAIYPESDVYNFQTKIKSRSGAEWQEGGLFIRYGDQNAYRDILQNQAEAEDFEDYDYDEGAKEEVAEKPKVVISIPKSHLFHFYSPWSWAKVFKIEYEKVGIGNNSTTPKSAEQDTDDDDDDDDADDDNSKEDDNEDGGDDKEKVEEKTKELKKGVVFPIRTFVFIYTGGNSQLTANLQNEPTLKTFTSQLDIREIQQPISLKFDLNYDTSSSEKKFNAEATSYKPTLKQFTVSTNYQTQAADFFNGLIEIRTPFKDLEYQSISTIHARNAAQKTYDWEIKSDTFGKFGSNLVFGPKTFSLYLTTPFESLPTLELNADSKDVGGSPNKLNTIVTIKTQEKQLLDVEVESIIVNGWPTQMSGTITTTLRGYREGNLAANVETSVSQVNANGHIDWKDTEKMKVTLLLKMPSSRFEELDLKVETPFQNYKIWRIWVKKEEDETDAENYDDEAGDNDDDDNEDYDDDDEENKSKTNNNNKDTFSFVFKIDTPISGFTTVAGRGSFPTVSSFHAIKKMTLSGNAPNGSIDIMTTWIISDWNSFDIHCDSKYTHSIETTALPSALHSLPSTNFLKFKLRNVIPSLETISLIDSSFYYELQEPAFRLGSTILLELSKEKSLSLKLSAKLPNDIHSIDIKSQYDANLLNINGSLAYTFGFPSTTWTTQLQMKRDEKSLEGDVEIDLGKRNPLQSKFNYTFNERKVSEFHLQLFAKKSPKIPIATIDGNFDLQSGRHQARLYALDQNQAGEPILVDVNMVYENLLNFDSILNATTPYNAYSSFGFQGFHSAKSGIYEGIFVGDLVDNKAGFRYNVGFDSLTDLRKFNGSISLELPFEEFKSGSIGGSINKKLTSFESTLRAEFNSIVYLNTKYRRESSSKAGEEIELRHLDIGNPFWPFGITKSYKYQYSGGYGGSNLPTTTVRLIEVYDLVQRDLHKLGGELKIQKNFNGREITLSGIYPTRRVTASMDYEFLDHQFKQNANFKWSPESSIGYEFNIKNKTTEHKVEHQIDLNIHYPVRSISLNSVCLSQGALLKLTTELNMNSSQSERKLTGIFNWQGESKGEQKLTVGLKHPALTQDIQLEGRFKLTNNLFVVSDVKLDYSGNPRRSPMLNMETKLPFEDLYNSNYYYWNFTNELIIQHLATNLDLKAYSSTQHSPHELSIITLIDFKNREKLSRKSKISFELFKQLREVHIMLSNPEENLGIRGEMTGQHPFYYVSVETNVTDIQPQLKGQMAVDLSKPYFRMYAVHGRDLTDGIYSEGGIIDSRNVKFQVYESYDNYKFSDVNFYLRMNHSRLVTSKLKWRPELLEEIERAIKEEMERLQLIWNQQSNKLVHTASTDASQVVEQIWEDAETSIGPFIQEMRDNFDFGKDSQAFVQFFKDAQENNDFYSQDIGGMAQVFADEVSIRYANIFIKIREYRQEILGDTTTTEMFENSLLWILEKMKETYKSLSSAWKQIKIDINWPSPSSTNYSGEINEAVHNLYTQVSYAISAYPKHLITIICQEARSLFSKVGENMLIVVHNIADGMANTMSSMGKLIGSSFIHVFERYKPTLLEITHRVEVVLYNILVEVADFAYEAQNEVLNSSMYQKIANVGRDVDQLYYDLTKYSAKTNMRKYSTLLRNFIKRKLGDLEEYQNKFGDAGKILSGIWNNVQNFGPVKSLKATTQYFGSQISWTIHYFKLEYLFQDLAITLYQRGHDLLFQTALEANDRFQQLKTRFIFDADKGIIEWEQKLPMPWNEFNNSPVFTELPEYKNFMKLQNLFQSSGESLWDAFYKADMIRTTKREWLPPFDAHAMMVGHDKFFSFDGKFFNFIGPCTYLLTSDLVDGNFSIAVQYKKLKNNKLGHQTIVTAGHNTLIFDFEENSLKDPKKNYSTVSLPIQMQYLQGYQDKSYLVVQHANKAFTFTCNMLYQICQLEVSGWYSRKLGGLFGTMDGEPTTDMMMANGQITNNTSELGKSWDVTDENVEPCLENIDDLSTMRTSLLHESKITKISVACNNLFVNKLSSLQRCFDYVNVDPFLNMCLTGTSDKICTAALAYTFDCQLNGIQVQVPRDCLKCELNGEEMIDNDLKMMDSSSSQNFVSTDTILVIEAKDCNRNIRTKKRMANLIQNLESELSSQGFKDNRYAVVAFGGSGVYQQPHTISYKSQIFTNASYIEKYFRSLSPSSGTIAGDIHTALNYSLGLDFRAGVSKTLILFPCSSCDPKYTKLEFSTIRHAMLQQEAALHILMNNDFPLESKKLAKKFFGLSNQVAYTKLDGKKGFIKGNSGLRKQVKISRRNLGYCSHLAFETNGTIFNGKKLNNKRENVVKWFTTIFTKVVADRAKTTSCRTCSCIADEYGLGKLECFLCDNPRFKYFIQNQIEIEPEKTRARGKTESSPTNEPDSEEYSNLEDDDIDDDY